MCETGFYLYFQPSLQLLVMTHSLNHRASFGDHEKLNEYRGNPTVMLRLSSSPLLPAAAADCLLDDAGRNGGCALACAGLQQRPQFIFFYYLRIQNASDANFFPHLTPHPHGIRESGDERDVGRRLTADNWDPP